MLTQAS